LSAKIIHIAGTNGKGSTAHYLNQILMSAGKRVGLFTSPHLLKWQERIQINGKSIDLPDDYEKKLYDGGFFINTAHLAKAVFEKEDLDYIIIETGIGGKKDITMMFDADISVITTISKDHMDILGHSIAQIAEQKAGIIRKNSVVYCHPQRIKAKKIIQQRAYFMRSKITFLSKKQIKAIKLVDDVLTFDFMYKGHTFKKIVLSTASLVQAQNAAMAFMIAVNEGVATPYIRKGLLVPIHGRTQVINKNLVLDVAHNAESFVSLKRMLKAKFKNQKINLFLAVMNSKDIKGISKVIRSFSNRVFLVDLKEKSFYEPKEISHFFRNPTYLVGSEDALYDSFIYAKEKSLEEQAVLVVCGTFRLTGAIYDLINSVYADL